MPELTDPLRAALDQAGLRGLGPAVGGGWAVTRPGEPAERAVVAHVVASNAPEVLGWLPQLHHPHLVPVLGALPIEDGRVLLLREAVAGRPASALAEAGALTEAEAVTLLVPIAQALGAVHEAGLTFGSFSLDAVVVRQDGMPVLTDLARLLDGVGSAGADLVALVEAVLALLPSPELYAAVGLDDPPLSGSLRAVLARPDATAADVVRCCFAAAEPAPLRHLGGGGLLLDDVPPTGSAPLPEPEPPGGGRVASRSAADRAVGPAGGEQPDGPSLAEAGSGVAPDPDHDAGVVPDADAGLGVVPDADAGPGVVPDADARTGVVPEADARTGVGPDAARRAAEVVRSAGRARPVDRGRPARTVRPNGRRRHRAGGSRWRQTTLAAAAAVLVAVVALLVVRGSGGTPTPRADAPGVIDADPARAAVQLSERRAALLGGSGGRDLASVEVVGGPAFVADTALVGSLGGVRLVGHSETVGDVSAVAVGADGTARVRLTTSESGYLRIEGSSSRTVAPSPPRTVELELRRTADGWRVWSVSPPSTP